MPKTGAMAKSKIITKKSIKYIRRVHYLSVSIAFALSLKKVSRSISSIAKKRKVRRKG